MALIIIVGLFIFFCVRFYKKSHKNNQNNGRIASNTGNDYATPYEDISHVDSEINSSDTGSENPNMVNAEIAEYEEYDGIYDIYGNSNKNE